MRNLLPLLLVLMIGFSAYSQDAAKVTKQDNRYNITAVTVPVDAPAKDATYFWHESNPFVDATTLDAFESTIGDTYYDMQTNTSLSNRLHLYPDGTIGGVWTRSLDDGPGFDSRGTGYNYFDGNDWGPAPTERLESLRTGWPSYAPWGPNGEIIVSHHTSIEGLAFSRRENKGTGDWTQWDYEGSIGGDVDPTWPRMTTSGEENEYIHVFYNSYNDIAPKGQRMYYTRSSDGGDSWDIEDVILDGTGDDAYFDLDGDDQTLAVRGSTIVMFNTSKWTDAFIMKSTDHGETWEKTVVWQHPYEMFDWAVTMTDTFWTSGGSGSVAIDNDGKVHVVFSLAMVLYDVPGSNSYTTFISPYVDGVVYWNEDMPTLGNTINTLAPPIYEEPESEMVADYNYVGWTQDEDGSGSIEMENDKIITYRASGVSNWPSIIIDDNNQIFFVYSTPSEAYSNFDFYYRKIWGRAFANGSWGPFFHITEPFVHIFDESVYPTLAAASDGNIHMLYQNDGEPGHNLNGTPDHDPVLNSMIYAAVPKSDFLTGIGDDDHMVISSDNVTQNYPNPFTDFTTISVYLDQGADLTLEVTNLIGQKVFAQDRGSVGVGTYHFTIDARTFESGIYFYTVTAGTSTVTKKMIVK